MVVQLVLGVCVLVAGNRHCGQIVLEPPYYQQYSSVDECHGGIKAAVAKFVEANDDMPIVAVKPIGCWQPPEPEDRGL